MKFMFQHVFCWQLNPKPNQKLKYLMYDEFLLAFLWILDVLIQEGNDESLID